jgi:hypothetical protein
MPNFPDLSLGAFGIPASALIYGQSFMCLSLTPASIDTLGANFQIYNPQVYSSTYSNTSASVLPTALVWYRCLYCNAKQLHFTHKHIFPFCIFIIWVCYQASIYPQMAAFLSGTRRTATAATNVATLTTRGGVNVTHFAKNPKWARDLYGDLVAPTLNASLWVETWMRPFEPSLYPPNVTKEVINVKQLNDAARYAFIHRKTAPEMTSLIIRSYSVAIFHACILQWRNVV